MSRRRWKKLHGAQAAKGIELALEEARKADAVPVPAPRAVEPLIRNPVEIYEQGRWVTVDKSTYDFPHPVKMKITPEWALDAVTDRNTLNRPVRDDRVEKYIADIVSGQWNVINNGFGFYENGQLADGQHRLWAVVESQIAVDAIVVFGMSKDAVSSIDEGASRSTKDVAHLMGIEAGPAHLSVTNYILEYREVRRTTPRRNQLEFYQRHKEAVEFVVSKLKRTGIKRAPVMAACMRAWYNVDRNRLAEFLQVLDNGQMASPADAAAVTLREFLMRNNNNSGSFRAEMYRKTEAAIVNFFEGAQISRLYGMEKEQFLLPEENLETAKSLLAVS